MDIDINENKINKEENIQVWKELMTDIQILHIFPIIIIDFFPGDKKRKHLRKISNF